jgi:hypothetical protein
MSDAGRFSFFFSFFFFRGGYTDDLNNKLLGALAYPLPRLAIFPEPAEP